MKRGKGENFMMGSYGREGRGGGKFKNNADYQIKQII
jgi:hypothetical protein